MEDKQIEQLLGSLASIATALRTIEDTVLELEMVLL